MMAPQSSENTTIAASNTYHLPTDWQIGYVSTKFVHVQQPPHAQSQHSQYPHCLGHPPVHQQ